MVERDENAEMEVPWQSLQQGASGVQSWPRELQLARSQLLIHNQTEPGKYI